MSNQKRKGTGQQAVKKEYAAPTLSDSLDNDVLEKLKTAKTELIKVEQENEEQRQKQIRKERKEREKNKSFEELLNEHEGYNVKS